MFQTIESVDVLSDLDLQRRLVRDSLAVCIAGVVATAFWAFAGPHLGWPLGRWGEGLPFFVAVFVASALALPVHELVHGLFFKLLGPAGLKLSFGYKDGMLYAGSPGAVLGRVPMMCVLLSPAAVLTVAFVLLGWAFDAPLAAFACIWVHLAGCVGDLAMLHEILRCPEASFVRDTDTGIDLLREEGSAHGGRDKDGRSR